MSGVVLSRVIFIIRTKTGTFCYILGDAIILYQDQERVTSSWWWNLNVVVNTFALQLGELCFKIRWWHKWNVLLVVSGPDKWDGIKLLLASPLFTRGGWICVFDLVDFYTRHNPPRNLCLLLVLNRDHSYVRRTCLHHIIEPLLQEAHSVYSLRQINTHILWRSSWLLLEK